MSKVITLLSIVGLSAVVALGVHSHNTSFTQVAASKAGVCGINESGEVYCKGTDAPSMQSSWKFSEVSIPEEAGKVETLSMSDEGACVKTVKGEAYCWGNLVVGTKDLSKESDPVKVANNVRSVAVGGADMCVVESNAPWELHCSGKTLKNRLPAALQTTNSTLEGFQIVPVMTTLVHKPLAQLQMSSTNICASTLGVEGKEGLLQCSGSNEQGQLLPGLASKLPMPSIAVGNVPVTVGTVVRSVGLMEKIMKSMADLESDLDSKPSSEIVKPIFDRGTMVFNVQNKVLCGQDVKTKELFCQGGEGEFATSAVSGIKVKQYAADATGVCVVDEKDALQCATNVKPTFYTVREEGEMEDVAQLKMSGNRVVVLGTDGDIDQIILN